MEHDVCQVHPRTLHRPSFLLILNNIPCVDGPDFINPFHLWTDIRGVCAVGCWGCCCYRHSSMCSVVCGHVLPADLCCAPRGGLAEAPDSSARRCEQLPGSEVAAPRYRFSRDVGASGPPRLWGHVFWVIAARRPHAVVVCMLRWLTTLSPSHGRWHFCAFLVMCPFSSLAV